jgi:Xaa-Pro dipeptidase
VRIKALKKELASSNLDGYLSTNLKNVYYFTGFSSLAEAETLIPLDGDPILFIQELELENAKANSKNCIIEVAKKDETIVNKIASVIENLKPKRLGLDDLPASTYLGLVERFGSIEFKVDVDIVWKLRMIKDDNEVRYIRKAAKLADAGMETALAMIKAGVREYQVAAEAEYAMRVAGSEGVAFDTLVASGPRSSLPHGICSDRKIKEGDVVFVDVGATFNGYRSDITRAAIVGKPTMQQAKVYAAVLEAQEEAIKAIHANVSACEVDEVARRVLKKSDYENKFIHGLGHGIGLDTHEPPKLSPSSKDVLEMGNVITIEPGVYIPYKWGIRIEDTVLVLKKNAERLTKTQREIIQ